MTRFDKANCIGFDLAENIELGRKKWNVTRGEEGEWIESLASSTRHMREKCDTTIEVRYNATNFLPM